MVSFEDHISNARRSLTVAEHMLTRTYPSVEDPRLILAIAGDIYAALASCMESFLVLEGKYKLPDDFSEKLAVFRDMVKNKGFSEDDFSLLVGLHHIIQEHKDSPVEFARKDKFVICDDKYRCDVLSIEDMKKYLFKAGLFIAKVEGIQGEMRERAEDE